MIAGSRSIKECPRWTLERMFEFLGDAEFYVLTENMELEELLNKLFVVFYHHEGVLYVRRRRRSKEQRVADKIEISDTMGILADHGADAFDRVIVYNTHYQNEHDEWHEHEVMEADGVISQEEFEEIFKKNK